jgi:hypothetical protein
LHKPKTDLGNRPLRFDPIIYSNASHGKRKKACDDNQIPKHLNFWDVKRKPCPVANVYPPLEGLSARRAPPKDIFQVDDDSATPNADATIIDQDYPVETYI